MAIAEANELDDTNQAGLVMTLLAPRHEVGLDTEFTPEVEEVCMQDPVDVSRIPEPTWHYAVLEDMPTSPLELEETYTFDMRIYRHL